MQEKRGSGFRLRPSFSSVDTHIMIVIVVAIFLVRMRVAQVIVVLVV